MSICELWVARCAAAAIDSGFDLDLVSFGEERTFLAAITTLPWFTASP